ncbi:MAG: YcgN family cysteine cluster protein [Pseudomonadales bacterium]
MTRTRPFWQTIALADMDKSQWESLCDGCARCCLHKLEDEDTHEVHYTSVVCRYLDSGCRCTGYESRHTLVPDCVVLTPDRALSFKWLPTTCAYRLLAEGKDLPAWHPLVSGNPESVHEAGISVAGKTVNESYVHPQAAESYIIKWVET